VTNRTGKPSVDASFQFFVGVTTESIRPSPPPSLYVFSLTAYIRRRLTKRSARGKRVKVVEQTGPNFATYELQSPNTNLTLGLHKLFIHLVFSTIDVKYIGYTRGSSSIVPLRGNLTIR